MFDFKGLINALLRKTSDDPVGDLKSATIWVQELPQNDIHQAQQEIVKALGGLNRNADTSLKERIRVLLYLDDKASSLQETLCREYLAATDDPDNASRQLLPTILQFWEEMGAGYEQCIRSFAKNSGSTKIREQLPLLTAKALHFHAMQAKWSHMRYLPVEAHVWRRLHRLFLFAEQEKIDRIPVRLQPQQDDTSCASEYLQPMMLHLANPASLRPAQIESIDLWLDSWAKSLVIESDFRPHRQLYAVNLGDTKPARKLRRNMLGEKYRYWGIELMLVTITKIVEQLKQGELPARLKLGEDCRLPSCLELIEEVMERWSGQSTTRKHARVTAEKSLLVMQNFANIVSYLQSGKNSGVTATFSVENTNTKTALKPSGEPELFEPGAQQWQVENESLSGYGVTFTRNSKEPLKIGTLVGLKAAIGKSFAIGIVRRISNEPPRKVHAGIQTLSQTAIVVELHPLPGEQGAPSPAIYLPDLPKLQLGRSLLLLTTAHTPARLVQLKAQGKTYTIRLQAAVERGPDYVQTGFDVVAKG
ncbi:MAG: hypothetical protein KKH74_08290 [Gammaproteobacteria bacterium]|nr:hypothetical protein [Gammaproteobacteria bacterium]MBU1732007.1 hypothetical protein [Gammaproteobacteria bacterium]MBU1894048.1 hypothetical protein [Gammaproteobacteria bacterium]